MNSKLNMLLRLGLSVGLQDRDAFVEKVSKLLQEKAGFTDDESENIGEKLLATLDVFKDELFVDQIFSKATKSNKKIETQIEELKKAVDALNRKIDDNN